MRSIIPTALLCTAGSSTSAFAEAMHDWGMWFSMLVMIGVPAALVIVAVAFARWLGDRGGCRSPREILNERYARGEIDREEYLRRRQDITGA